MGLELALYVAGIVSFCFPHVADVSALVSILLFVLLLLCCQFVCCMCVCGRK